MTQDPSDSENEASRAGAAASRVRHVLERVRDEGPAESFRRYLYRHGVYRRLAIIVNPRLNPLLKRNPSPTALVGSRLDPSEIDDYLELRPDQSRAEIESRLAAEHIGLIVRQEGRVVAHSWVGLGRVPLDYLDCTMELAPDAGHQYDDYVASELRGVRVLPTIVPLRAAVLDDLSIRWNIALILPENELAFRRIARHRPVFVGEIGRLALGPRRRLFLRLDRELIGSKGLPATFIGADGRPPRTRRVEGPLLLSHSPWITDRSSPPVFPLSRGLDRSGLLRRRLVTVFDSGFRTRGVGRFPVAAARLDPSEIEEYRALRPDQARTEIEDRLRAGHVCFVGRAFGRVVAASWLAPGGSCFGELGCEVRLAQDAAGVYDQFVSPPVRRQHVLDPVADLSSEHALLEGWKRCVALVPPEVPGAWIRMRCNERPRIGELARMGVGRWARWRLWLDSGIDPAELPCSFASRSGEVAIRTR